MTRFISEGSPGTVGGWDMVIIEEVDAGLFDGDVSDHLWFKVRDVCWKYKQRKIMMTGTAHLPLRAASKNGEAKTRISLCALLKSGT